MLEDSCMAVSSPTLLSIVAGVYNLADSRPWIAALMLILLTLAFRQILRTFSVMLRGWPPESDTFNVTPEVLAQMREEERRK